MDLITTLPEDTGERGALMAQAARLHAGAICTALESLRCPAERKTALLRALIRSNRRKKRAESSVL